MRSIRSVGVPQPVARSSAPTMCVPVWCVVCVLLCLAVRPAHTAGGDAQKRVLLVHMLRRDPPVSTGAEDVYRKVLGDALGSQLDYYSEYIDERRFGKPQYRSALRA